MLLRLHVNQNLFLSFISKSLSITFLFVFFTLSINAQTLISRTVSNTTHCNNASEYGTYLNFSGLDNYYHLTDGSLIEYSDGTANITGTITNNTNAAIQFTFDVTLSGRTFTTPSGSPKASNCGNTNTSDWYYYTSTWGTYTGIGLAAGAQLTVERAGPSFQLGTGANQTEGANIFNACGWLDITIVSQPNDVSLVLSGSTGDININLDGEALIACDDIISGGKIGPYEVAGGPFTASTIISEEDPTSAGAVQYMWLKSNDPTLPWSQWTVLTGEANKTLEPGDINETTYFLRCSRTLGCTYWSGESNIIAKIINGDGLTCNAGAIETAKTGNAQSVHDNSGVDYSSSITGAIDEDFALFYDENDMLIIKLDDELAAGDQVTISWKSRNYSSSFSGNSQLEVRESTDGINFYENTTLETGLKTFIAHQTITLNGATNYLKLSNGTSLPDFEIDAISYNLKTCEENGSIGNFVWEDLNGDGLQDAGEPGIPGVYVFLEDSEGNIIADEPFQMTDPNGYYTFEDLPYGDYRIRFVTPNGYLPTKPYTPGNVTTDSDAAYLDGRSGVIELNSTNQHETSVDAGYIRRVELIGIVWYDNDENGTQENSVDGVIGVKVTLYDAGADMTAGTADDLRFGDTNTDPNGFYTFTGVHPGKYYTVIESTDLPEGYSFTSPNSGSDDSLDSDTDQATGFSDVFDVTSNVFLSGIDAGIRLTCGFIPSASVSETACIDSPVDFAGSPDDNTYSYHWEFFDAAVNAIRIGESFDKITSFTWITSGDKNYTLTVTDASGCFVTIRRTVTILAAEDSNCEESLPVELIDFSADIINSNRVDLKWSTAWEDGNDFFEIQRSTDGNRFRTIGSEMGAGTSEDINEYMFTDNAPFYGRNYYRLKQIDFDGTVDYSEIQSVLINDEALPDVVAYPNPTKDYTTLRVVTPFEEEATLEVVNGTGQVLEVIIIEAGTNDMKVDLSKYQAGLYFLNIKYNGFKTIVHRVLKIEE